jgi:hypothetical protein
MCVEGKSRICRVHEALLLVWLQCEDTQPEIERADKDDTSKKGLVRDGLLDNDVLNQDERERAQCEEEPYVEVQSEIAHVEMPWLDAIEIGAFAAAAEDIVHDYVQWYNGKATVEESFNTCLRSLGIHKLSVF